MEAGHVLLKSTETERQVFNVIARPYFVPLIGAEIRAWLTRLMSIAERVDIVERINACRDPTDDKFSNSPLMAARI